MTSISTRLLGKLNKEYWPFEMALFLAVGVLGFGIWTKHPEAASPRGILGGPVASDVEQASEAIGALISPDSPALDNGDKGVIVAEVIDSSLGAARDGGEILPSSGGITGVMSYKVKRGDTLSGIARAFGVSVQTIIGTNPEVKAKALRVGQELRVLPTSGVLYQVKEGETPESVAAAFNLTVLQIQEFNRSVNFNNFGAGVTLLIPGASPLQVASMDKQYAKLPVLKGYFVNPTEGFNWGILHNQNAVDIANSCGTRVNAAAEGLVVDESGNDVWSSGYGRYVIIEHPNNTKTRYAHLEKVSVSIGDYVAQGSQIGTMGNTGNVHGPTGCHLHLEVYGVANPFAK